jgi:hypothetical protein
MYAQAFRLAGSSWDPETKKWTEDPSRFAPRSTGDPLEDARALASFASDEEQPALRILGKQGKSVFKLDKGEFKRVIEGLKYLIPLRFAVKQEYLRWVDDVLRVRPLTLAMEDLTMHGGILIDPAPLETQLRRHHRNVTFTHLDLEEVAPIERQIIYRANMNEGALCPAGGVAWNRLQAPLIEIIEAAVLAGVQHLLLATFRPLARALESNPPACIQAWRQAGRSLTIASYWGEFDSAWSGCDGFATLGDPWPNLDEVTEHAEAYGLDPYAECEQRLRAELGRAHGVAKDPVRTEPARHLHMGDRAPLGWHAENTALHRVVQGRPKTVPAMSKEEFELAVRRLGGVKNAVLSLSLSIGTIRRYLRGLRAVPLDVAEAIQELKP